jgi:structural maintenance of chromosome 2
MAITQLQSSYAQKKAQVDGLSASYNKIKEKHTTLENALSNAEELLQSLLTGLSSSGGSGKSAGGGGYMGQIADARARAAQSAAEEEQCKVRLGMAERELKALEARWKDVEREAGDGKKKVEKMKHAVETCRTRLASCKWNQELENQGEARLRDARNAVKDLTSVG